MEAILTPDEMREADERTISGGTTGAELMERAAFACASVAARLLGRVTGSRVVVVCGKGNNGGDGIACARHLHALGAHVDALLVAEPSDGDPARHLVLARRAGVRFREWSADAAAEALGRADLAVDAVFGTGFSGAPRGAAGEACSALADPPCPVLAVDIPSGVSGTDGSVPGDAVRADVTVAIQALKIGHVTTPGTLRCGRVDVADIGITVSDARTCLPAAGDVREILPERDLDAHKYSAGGVALLAGSTGMTGAAVLATRGAFGAGAGIVFAGIPRSTASAVEGLVTEAVKVPLPDEEGQLVGKAVDEFSDRLDRVGVLAVGPGIGRGPNAVEVCERALATDLPLVVDGDGLWALGEVLARDRDVLRSRQAPVVCTPHAGEFAYLTGGRPSQDRIAAAREAASQLGAVVHLKGYRAVTASTEGSCWVNPNGGPTLATAGSGDVLTGIVAALVARGLRPSAAAWAGAWLHGAAGDLAASRHGAASVVASSVADGVGDVVRRLGRPERSSRIRTVLER